MSAEVLLDCIEQQGLLGEKVIASLRRQVAEADSPIAAEAVIKLLVSKGQITALQGKSLLAQVAVAGVEQVEDSEELTLGDIDEGDQPAGTAKPATTSAPVVASSDDLIELDDEVEEPKHPPSPPPPPGKSGGLVPIGKSSGLKPIGASSGLQPLGSSQGLEPLGSVGALGAGDPLGIAQQPAAPQKQQPRRLKEKKNPWESKLIYLGGTGLVVMLGLGVLLWFSLSTGTAEEMFKKAEDSYQSESYSESIDHYQNFVETYPDDENASLARVRIALAKLRIAVKGANDWTKPLEVAKAVLPPIEDETKFGEARNELAAMLPQIAEGFATKAQESKDLDQADEQLDYADVAMKELVLNPVYIPTSLRTTPGVESQIERIGKIVATVRRDINRERDLAAAVKNIEQAAEDGETAKAYQLRDELLTTYPGLVSREALIEAVLTISGAVKDQVDVVVKEVSPQPDLPRPPTEYQVVLAGRAGKTAAGLEGRVAVVGARGAVYGLEAASGKLLWRRFVGFDPAPIPQRASKQSGADAIVVDGRNFDLLRIGGSSGELVWRLPVGEAFADPAVSPEKLIIAARSGKILEVDAATGASRRQAVLPQEVSVGALIDPRRPTVYQVADHTNLFVLSSDDLRCQEVYYLGHKPGTIITRPVIAAGYIFVAENHTPDKSRLHVLATDADGLSLKAARPPIELTGRIVVPPEVYGTRVALQTDLGALHVLEVDATNKRQPVSTLDQYAATRKQPISSYLLAHEGRLFVANDRLTMYEIQTSRGKLARRWIKYDGDVFVAPSFAFGGLSVHVRRRRGAPGVSVAAVSGAEGDLVWQTELGAPLAGPATVDTEQKRFIAVSASGQLFEINGAQMNAGLLDAPTGNVANNQSRAFSLSRRIDLGDGRLAFSADSTDPRIAVYDPQGKLPLSLASPPLAAGSLACGAMYFQQGLLLPSREGQIHLVEVASGRNQALPFQPRLRPGQRVEWRRPVVLEGGGRFVICDNRKKLYRVALQSGEEPQLVAEKEVDLEMQIESHLTLVGDTIFAIARERNSDRMITISTESLGAGPSTPLQSRVAWGPEAVGDRVFVATSGKHDELWCFAGADEVRWKIKLPHGVLAGAPLAHDGDFILVAGSGKVWRVAGGDGAALGSPAEIGEPLGAGAIHYSDKLLLTGADGTLHVIPMITKP